MPHDDGRLFGERIIMWNRSPGAWISRWYWSYEWQRWALRPFASQYCLPIPIRPSCARSKSCILVCVPLRVMITWNRREVSIRRWPLLTIRELDTTPGYLYMSYTNNDETKIVHTHRKFKVPRSPRTLDASNKCLDSWIQWSECKAHVHTTVSGREKSLLSDPGYDNTSKEGERK